MRLRYVHLPDYPPLCDVEVVFRQETLLTRPGAVNFVVGLNGSGKSSLLRAIFDVFRALADEELPRFPVVLAWDILKEQHWTVVFHRSVGPASDAFIYVCADSLPFTAADEWRSWFAEIITGRAWEDMGASRSRAGDQLKGAGLLKQWLPSRVLAYTSGDITLWDRLATKPYPHEELSSLGSQSDERPQGWTPGRERLDRRIELQGDPAYDPPDDPVPSNHHLVLTADDLTLAGICLGLWQATTEQSELKDEASAADFRRRLAAEIKAGKNYDGPRRILKELDWFTATHISFRLADYRKHLRHADIADAFWLTAVADTVVRQPLDEALAVISLGPRPQKHKSEMIPPGMYEKLPEHVQMVGSFVDMAPSGADSVRQLFVGESGDEGLWLLFQRLRAWRAFGLLKDVELTVKRLSREGDSEDGDDSVICYSSFSDGERMLLGRFALLYLLQGQPNSLLLLDEPETHFNDAWQREIVDLVDDALLKTTAAQTAVADAREEHLALRGQTEFTLVKTAVCQAILDDKSGYRQELTASRLKVVA